MLSTALKSSPLGTDPLGFYICSYIHLHMYAKYTKILLSIYDGLRVRVYEDYD